MALDDLLRQFSIPFEDRVLTGRAALCLGSRTWMTMHLIEEEDDLYFEDEDRDADIPIFSIYYDIFRVHHADRMIESCDGACYRVREGQSIMDWLVTNELWPPIAELDLERMEEEMGLSIDDLESYDYELLFG